VNEVQREINSLEVASRDGPRAHTVQHFWTKFMDSLHDRGVRKALFVRITTQAL
jgi:transposase-like protein